MAKSNTIQQEFDFSKPIEQTNTKFIKRSSHQQKMISGTIAYKKYGIPRSMLRSLVDQGVIRMEEKSTGGPFVLKLYCQSDIENYMNGR